MKIRCIKCGDAIESKHRHDMVWCLCGSIAIDGGSDYYKITGEPHNIEFLHKQNELQRWLDANEEASKGLCPPSIFLKED